MKTVRFVESLCVAAAAAAALVISLSPGVRAEQPPALGEMLVRGLHATPGYLGVETASTSSGRNAIFAWFENKAAVKRWYYSETHKGAMAAAGAAPGDEPLGHIADDAGPIMVIASLEFTDRPKIDGLNLPVSSISIELYKPLPGVFPEVRNPPRPAPSRGFRGDLTGLGLRNEASTIFGFR